MTAIAPHLYEPRLQWAAEGLRAVLAQHGAARAVAWARAAANPGRRRAALAVFKRVPLALTVLERARMSKTRGDREGQKTPR